MSITSFDHFIETLEHVPSELRGNFQIMSELDRRVGEFVKRINSCVLKYKESDKRDERLMLYKESMDLFDKAKACSADKVELALQTYDLVDKHIRRLEGLSGAQAAITGNSGQASSDPDKKNNSSSGGQNQKSKNQKDNKSNSDLTPQEPTLAVDMPLDPNEPKYCTCHQVSFGEMIACDNKECPIEWFHFACVDLKTKPKGRWYCPECFNANKKVKHKFKKLKS